MERLEKLVNILKLTPHRQPELVKEAASRILSRSLRVEPNIGIHLKPLTEILIYYCDTDDSVERSLFNDYLNSVLVTYQYNHYKLLLQVLLQEITNNGSARAVTASLQRIPQLINNVKPIELGCDIQSLFKALVEVSRRSDEESVLRALDSALSSIVPYIGEQVKKNKDLQLLSNTLIEILMKNLQNESSQQTKRLAASSIAIVCSNSDLLLDNTLTKLKLQLYKLNQALDSDCPESSIADESKNKSIPTDKFVGFCLCVKEIPQLAEQYHEAIIEMIIKQVEKFSSHTVLMTSALETLKDLFKFPINLSIIDKTAQLIADNFLLSYMETDNGDKKIVMREDTKVILQANALACLSMIIKQKPKILDRLEFILSYKNHPDIAVSNQIILIIGNYIEASWRYPSCVEQSNSCERIRRLWTELRSILNTDDAHPDILKSCVIAFKTCINTLLESDHCVQIVERRDFESLIKIYSDTDYKPFKIEVLSLLSQLNYRTLNYLDKCHWYKSRSKIAGSYIDSIQDRVIKDIFIASLLDGNSRIRQASTTALVDIIANLYVAPSLNSSQRNISYKFNDPIISLACNLASENLVILKHTNDQTGSLECEDETSLVSGLHENLCVSNNRRFLSSSIVLPSPEISESEDKVNSETEDLRNRNRINITINLMYIIRLLRKSIEDNLDRGKTAVSSIVRALYELSVVYPCYQYSTAWDCKVSEFCDCFTLLNFLLSYMENLTEPDIVVEDLGAYRNFLLLSHELLYALCHESVMIDYAHQKLKPVQERKFDSKDGFWSELSLKHQFIADILETYFMHLTKLLWLCSYIIEEKSNPFAMSLKQQLSPTKLNQPLNASFSSTLNHGTLTSNRLLFGHVHKKLESSYKSGKKNLNQQDEKFYKILDTCLANIGSLLEFIGMSKSIEHVKDILTYLKVTSSSCNLSSLICARQLLKSLFGINILALYQVDPKDWFDEEIWPQTNISTNQHDYLAASSQGVYHHLISHPYKIFSSRFSKKNESTSDKPQPISNPKMNHIKKVKDRIEDRVTSLFKFDQNQLISPKIKQVGDTLKSIITEFTPIVTDCINQYKIRGSSSFQSEILHFMSYLILLKVNYQKLLLAEDLLSTINKQLSFSGEVHNFRDEPIEVFIKNSNLNNISPEVFHPVSFMYQTFFKASHSEVGDSSEFQRWMSHAIISVHIMITRTQEDEFLNKIHSAMPIDKFINLLLHSAQLCVAEINLQLFSINTRASESDVKFLVQQLASYILYLTHIFQSGFFFQLSRSAAEFIRKEIEEDLNGENSLHEKSFRSICEWSRDVNNKFSLYACERMFYEIRLIHPDLTIYWCNVMMLLNNVNCNKDYWRNLLVYECNHCTKLRQNETSSQIKSTDIAIEGVTKGLIDFNILNSSEDSSIYAESNMEPIGSQVNLPPSLKSSDVNFSDHLAPNIELARRGTLCLVLDFVTISMNDVEHITWLIINFINDIVRWSHELPITEFINSVHGNPASSGIFIQAIYNGCNDLTSISFVTRLLWSLQQVHYSRYGQLLILLVEKLLSSQDLKPYRSLLRDIEEFACSVVKKLLNETNKSLVTTSDEVFNQLPTEELNRLYSILDTDLYPNLTKLLMELCESIGGDQVEAPAIQSITGELDSDQDSQADSMEMLYAKAKLAQWLGEKGHTGQTSTLIPAIAMIKSCLSDSAIAEQINQDKVLICLLISAIYSLATNCIPPPMRLIEPKFWNNQKPLSSQEEDIDKEAIMLNPKEFNGKQSSARPMILVDSKRPVAKMSFDQEPISPNSREDTNSDEIVESLRVACLKALFLVENIELLKSTRFDYLIELIIKISRLETINSFVMTPPMLWRQNNLVPDFDQRDKYKIDLFPMVTYEILSKDLNLLDNFCDRLLKLGWTSRRQFEEAWMILLGVLSSTLSAQSNQVDCKDNIYQDVEKKTNLLMSCKVVSTITKFLLLTKKDIVGDPTSSDTETTVDFDDRLIDLTKTIRTNLSSLKKKTQSIIDLIESGKKAPTKSIEPSSHSADELISESGFSYYLRIPAQKLRMRAILSASLDMQDIVVIENKPENLVDIDVESCVRLLMSIYKQKLADPNDNLYSANSSISSTMDSMSSTASSPSALQLDELQQGNSASKSRNDPSSRQNQLDPPLATAICQSILVLSDMFTYYEHFSWLFETFIQMFKLAERNEDEVQQQFLIIGLCKSASVCCYEIPNELSTTIVINHRDVMFEKCRQSLEKCLRSDFGPLKMNALYSIFYMLEDSINIVASGAWELDHFRQLRQSRLSWIVRLMPIILDKQNFKLLTKNIQLLKLLELLCETVTESELKAIKN